MSPVIDLMPRACRDALGRRILVRRWTLVYLLTATVLFGTFWFLRASNQGLIARRDNMATQVKINWSRSEVVTRLLKEIGDVEAAVKRYNRLAWPVRARDAIDAIAAALPGSASLVEISITPREEKPTAAAKAAPKSRQPDAPAEAPRMHMVIEMEGLATSDSSVATFVSALDANSVFSRVSLDFSRAKQAGEQEVRNFRVTAEVDLSVRYSFAAAAEGGQ